MLPVVVVAACSTAAACDGVEIGPPLWVLATAMVGIFVLLIGGAIAVGAAYRHKSQSAVVDRPGPAAHPDPPAHRGPSTQSTPATHPARAAHPAPAARPDPAGRRPL